MPAYIQRDDGCGEAAEDGDMEPPYVGHMSDDELENLHLTPLKTGVLCHTQSTQPGIAEVTAFREASLAVVVANTARAAIRPCCHLLAGSVPKHAAGLFQPMSLAKNSKKEVKKWCCGVARGVFYPFIGYFAS